MAEVRKRNTKAPAASPASSAQTRAPARSNNVLYLALSGLAALAIYYFSNTSSTVPSNSTTSSSSTTLPSSTTPTGPSGRLQLTDDQLKAYTGADPDKPIYVALNGTIFDVSQGRAFYGPGGHYGHFAGRDATRAWVSECFQPEYLTWDMKGIENMFLPKWMDEEIEDAAAGKSTDLIPDALKAQAGMLVEKFGKVSKKEREKRREEDEEEVKAKIDEAMSHWINFFKGNSKYKEVGEIVGRKELPEDREDPGLCEEALKKRPVRGGKFEKMLGQAIGMGMGGDREKAKKPDFVKDS